MAETTMEEVISLEGELIPCEICGRTFLEAPLAKHRKVCERNVSKQRRVFDSQKQRVEGTDFAPFHQTQVKKSITGTPYAVDAFKKVKGVVDMTAHSASATSLTHDAPGTERCPSCDRQFGPRAYDRHVEWCKEHVAYVHRSPAQVLLAKERLEARIKYRVPAPKSKRAVVKEKYSPSLGSRTDSLTSIKSCTYLDQTPKIQKQKPVVALKKLNDASNYNHGDSVEVIKKNEKVKKNSTNFNDHIDPTNSTTQSDYNPFLTAERQLMELLECEDFKPFINKTESTKVANRPHTVSGSKMRLTEANHHNNNNKFVKSAENTRKKLDKNGESTKRVSVIDPPTDFQDGDDFELIESLINQNYLEGYNLLDEINENTDEKMSDHHINLPIAYFKFNDDSPIIDPRLINENDNLAIPDNLIVHHSSSNSSNDNLAPSSNVINQRSSSVRHLTRSSEKLYNTTASRGFSPNSKATKSAASNSKLTKSKKPTVVRKPSVSLHSSSASKSKNLSRPDIRKPVTSFKKSLSVQEAPKSKSKFKHDSGFETLNKPTTPATNIINQFAYGDFAKSEDLFEVDDVMLEEFKKFEENYLKDKDEQRRKKEQGLQETSINLDNVTDGPISKSNIDSAYNSLNRSTTKVRAKPNSLSPLEFTRPEISPTVSPASSGSDTVSVLCEPQKRVSKFCHECGTKYPIATAKFCVECGVKRLVL
ncbi:hypothetical protein RI129_009770 [Pyrocoelia pectoralis]|uniref:C2HC/C3H-type domain-containing protein n=1 Tax=Pyrocoelia pectoralis TaxID=417401 RepID=A0AAN7V926_9COLE